MKNLEQIRARNAYAAAQNPEWNFRGEENGEVIKKVPPMILNHGLLASAAYGFAKEGWKNAFSALATHLSDPDIGLLLRGSNNHKALMEFLTREASTQELKLITAEALAWFNYARRFIRDRGNGDE